jgi:predicted transcriptional regulator
MKNLMLSIPIDDEVALISIHPQHVEKIISGEKNIEFRRVWPERRISSMVVYSTSPIQRIAAVIEITDVLRASRTTLWKAASLEGGGVTKQVLFDYLEGKQQGIGLRLGQRVTFSNGILPSTIFGKTFRPPQSFRYLSIAEKNKIKKLLDKQS